MTWEAVVLWFQQGILVYFALLNLLYALFGYLGIRSVIVYARGVSRVALRDLLELEFYKPVSILVPAHNEEGSIVASVRSMLGLHHPEFEVVVAQDGSTDRTLEALVEAFSLVEVPLVYRKAIDTKPVRRILRSVRYPNLIVVDKENGGKSDAVNAALNVARYPLVCAVDADSLLNAEALLRASRAFVEDDRVVAVGGTVRPLNGAVLREGTVRELRVPKRWLERFQILEYARGFFTGRAAWSKFGALLIISGAFGVFRRDVLLEAGGMWTGTVTEDMEIVVRLHRMSFGKRRPYRVLFTPDPICWTEVPSDLGTLRRQRNRWHRGLWETLWRHRGMLLRPRYGSVGLVGLPYFWLFEGIGPVVEMLGYVTLVASIATGSVFAEFAVPFLILSVLFGMLLSQLAVGIETMLLARYERLSDRFRLFAACFLEMFGYRQLMTWERFIATFQVRRKPHTWGAMKRAGIPAGDWSGSRVPGAEPEPEPAPESRSEARPL
jgi:cellulose synthase/poly-beta-1,6-N-acetylglucosamine synthase-like glycosyltransferase